MREGVKSGRWGLERMKHGNGVEDRDDESSGMLCITNRESEN
jgi:hypothetical protein